MAKISILAGTTSKLVDVFIQDSTSTTGAGLTGLTNASSGLVWYYYREGAGASVQVTSIASMTLGTFTTKGFIVIDGTNMPGCYQLGVPDAALAAGAKSVIMMLKGATNMVPLVLEIELTAVDNQDSVRYGMSALPNASANAVGGLPVLDANSLVDVDVKRWLATAVTAATAGIPDVNAKNINNVSASSVTTINANIGTTQPTNFTGTGASALVKSDMVDIAGAAVSTSTAQIGVNAVNWAGGAIPAPNVTGVPLIDLKYTLGTISPAAAGYVGIDWAQIHAPTTVQGLTGTTISSSQVVASVTGAVGSVTGNVGGNVTGSVGSVVGNVGGNVVGSVGSVVGLNPALLDVAVSTRATPAQVLTEVEAGLSTDTYAEPTGAPTAPASIATMLAFLYEVMRNKLTTTSSSKTFYDHTNTSQWSKALSDDGTTFTEAQGS